MATKRLYLDDFDVTSCTATVIKIHETDDGRWAVILDQTCFYPRGGGQDWDTGTIIQDSQQFDVEEVRLDDAGEVHHIGNGTLDVGTEVTCQVDDTRRDINTRLHSAGHVIDMATSTIQPNWIPGRGAHYPHMSFVEYEDETHDPDAVKTAIQQKVDELLDQNIINTLQYVNRDELEKLCRHVPDNIPTNKPTRVVLYGDFGVPCGGTHVRKLSDIGKLEVTKVKTKKGLTKVSYRIEGIN